MSDERNTALLSTMMVWPVTDLYSSLSKYLTLPTRSSVPKLRRMLCLPAITCFAFFNRLPKTSSVSSVMTADGAITLTRIQLQPSWRAMERVMSMTAAFNVAWCRALGMPKTAAREAILMMLPPPLARKCGITALQHRHTPETLISIMLCNLVPQ